MRDEKSGDETHGDQEKREAEKPHQQELCFSLKVVLHRSLLRASKMVLRFHGNNASIASSAVAVGNRSNSSLSPNRTSTAFDQVHIV